MYLYSGGAGNTGGTNGGFNGGGLRDTYNSGGGASDIRITTNDLQSRVIVAGGGGSDGAINKQGMYGGGTSGGTATQNFGSGGGGGTQTSGGAGGNNNSGSFGVGGRGIHYANGYGGAGGGGWYGGGGVYPDGSGDDDRGGGGGSGFVWTGSNVPTNYRLSSLYYLSNASTIAGNTSFTSPTGEVETGHSGNGYVRITVIEIKSNNISIYSKNLNTLPSGYIELEYIQITGSQYINTEVIPNNNIGFDATFEVLTPLTSSPYYNLFGVRGNDVNGGSSETQNFFRIDTIPVDNNTGTELKFGTTVYNSGITGSGKVHIELKNKVYIKPNGSKIQLTGNITNTYPIYIGCLNKGNNAYGNKSVMKIYNFKLYNGNTMVRNFIPALRESDKKTGLYDVVNNKFYTDAAGGNFTCNNVKDPQCIAYLNGEYLNDQSNNAIRVQNNNITLSEEQKFNGKSTLKCSGNAYMYIPFPTSQTGDITIECWIYQISNTNSTWPTPYTLISSSGRGLYLHQNANQTYCATSSSGQQMTTTATKPVLNKWVHLVQCLSGTTTYCFVDGTLIGAIANTNTTYVGLTLGTLSESSSNLLNTTCYWQGYIGEVKVSKGCKYLTNYTEQANPFKDYFWKSNNRILFKKSTNENAIPCKDVYIKFNPQFLVPNGYTVLEYVESTGIQYIDTGLTVNKTDSYEMILTTHLTSNNNYAGANGYLQFQAKIGNNKKSKINIKYKNKIETIFVDDQQVSSTDWSTSYNGTNVKLGIFKLGDTNNTWYSQTGQSGKLYSCKILNNNNLIRNFVPCKNTSGILGLYDTVNNVFYTNAGTGTFTAGPIATTSWVKIGSL